MTTAVDEARSLKELETSKEKPNEDTGMTVKLDHSLLKQMQNLNRFSAMVSMIGSVYSGVCVHPFF